MAIALFILGHAGSGKTQLATKFVKSQIAAGKAWCMLDKDTTGQVLGHALMTALGLDPNDRDSPAYKEKIRDLEYEACLSIIREQLKLGVNVAIPGPWNKEIVTGKLFSVTQLDFPTDTVLKHVYLDLSETDMKEHIIRRGSHRDHWKLKNWELYAKKLGKPQAITENGVLSFNKQYSHSAQLARLIDYVNN